MASIIDLHVAEKQAYLARYRRTYLRSIATELGMPNMDIRDVALREIAALAEMVQQLDADMAAAIREAAET